jgi:hypothetical protein
VNSLKLNVGCYFIPGNEDIIDLLFHHSYCRIRKKRVIPRIVKIAMAYLESLVLNVCSFIFNFPDE